ncbi:hypothetical protein [uncultured Limosilactobacillus sp.]|nr:hypothetical protein [uncultured Limosilactobacillus sp.]
MLAVIALLCCLFLVRFVTPLAVEIVIGVAGAGILGYLGYLYRKKLMVTKQ